MEVNLELLNEVTAEAKTLSRRLKIAQRLCLDYGDAASYIDPYLHLYSNALDELSEFALDNFIFVFNDDEFKEFQNSTHYRTAILDIFATSLCDSEEDWTSTPEYIEKCSMMQHFTKLVTAYMYHRHRHTKYALERDVEERNCFYFWLEIRKFNRDNSIIRNVKDEELMNTIIAWYNASVHPKNRDLFENLDCKKNGEIIKTYVGPRPKIPESEMAEGYDFDTGI